MIDKLAHVEVVIENFNSYFESAKQEFSEVICDTSYPLDDRWNLFEKAASTLKNHTQFIVNFDFEKKLGIELNEYMYLDKYQTISSEEIIEAFEDNDESEESISIVKEEILLRNLGSFIFDW